MKRTLLIDRLLYALKANSTSKILWITS